MGQPWVNGERTEARIAGVPRLRNMKALIALARDSVKAWLDDFAPSMGAAISYYTIFSIAPLLLIVIAVAGLVFGADAAAGRIYAELAGLLGSRGPRPSRQWWKAPASRNAAWSVPLSASRHS